MNKSTTPDILCFNNLTFVFMFVCLKTFAGGCDGIKNILKNTCFFETGWHQHGFLRWTPLLVGGTLVGST